MSRLPLLAWNVVMALLLVVEAIRFDLHHFRRLGRRVFRRSPETWNLSAPERAALQRFLFWLAVDLCGNVLWLGLDVWLG